MLKQIDEMVKLGYLTKQDESYPEDQVREATKMLQEMYGLPMTGDWDAMTEMAVARTPRCGCSDVQAARDVINKWGKEDLTYFIKDRVVGTGITPTQFDDAHVEIFGAWQDACGLTFERVNNQQEADIVVTKARGRRAGFDGPSGTLAYAYLPNGPNHTQQLSLWYDMDEAWSLLGGRGTIGLIPVGRHEVGHNLGLDHTNTNGQLMLPTYSEQIITPQREDIQRVIKRYGQPKAAPITPSAPGTGDMPSSVDMLLLFNGDIVVGPQKIDLTKQRARLIAPDSF